MAIVNQGNQEIAFDYKHETKGNEFNKILRGMIKPGIYSGGNLSVVDATTAQISAFNIYVNVGTDKALRIFTSSSINITVNELQPIIYLTYTWQDTIENWADFSIRAESDGEASNEVKFGKAIFNDSTGALESFDISVDYRDFGLFDENYNTITQDLTVKGDATIEDNLTVNDNATVTGNLTVSTDPTANDHVGNRVYNDDRYLLREEDWERYIERLQTRLEASENKLMDLSIENSYIMGRASASSDYLLDLFNSEDYTYYQDTSGKIAEVYDDNAWDNNWFQTSDYGLEFKQGALRQQRQHYMLEVTDKFNLEGVGQSYKCAIDYDSTNSCYWLMTNAGGNAIGEIVKLSENMKDGKVEVLSRWYIPAIASTYWSGIASDGNYLYIVCYGHDADSHIYKFAINSDGTLGESGYTSANGETLDMTDGQAADNPNGDTGYWSDVISYDDDHLYVLLNEIGVERTLVALEKASLATGAATIDDITGLEEYIGGSQGWNRSVCKSGNDIYVRVNDSVDDYRFIYKIDTTTDLSASNVVIKTSGRWATTQDADDDEGITAPGICIGHHGDLLEVNATSSNGKYISRRAITNALWAENQVCEEVAMKSYDATNLPNSPHACMIEDDRYYWTGDINVGANDVDVFRYDTTTGSFKHARLTGAGWDDLYDLTYNPSTDVLYLIGYDNTNFEVYLGNLSDFVALMGDSYNIGNTVDITSWGTIATGLGTNGTGTDNTDVMYSICYDEDDDILYILNDTDDVIDTLSLDGTTWTEGVYDLPAPTAVWAGIVYKNNKIYIVDGTGSTNAPNFIYVIDKNLSDDTAWYRLHVYQDPASEYATDYSIKGIDFNGNDLVCASRGHTKFFTIKVLEDPNVMQLHTFLDSNNILLSDTCHYATPVATRYFNDQDDYADIRDMPDKYYMAVGYGDEGFSLLHLDTFFSGKSSTGKDRYDVTDIRVQHYKEGATNLLYNSAGETSSISIEKEIITRTDYSGCINYVDLKSGQAVALNIGTNTGLYYDGTLTERNDSKDYTGSYNAELNISNTIQRKLHARTFTKDDMSDYNGENPVTFVAIGTGGGCDLLRIDWDSNGNRTPVKVWNNIVTDISFGTNAIWIAPSGIFFLGDSHENGNVIKSIINVWDVNSDSSTDITTPIGSNILGGYVKDIAPNSRCWKTPSGEWRHQLLCSTQEVTGAGVVVLSLVDVENETEEQIVYYNSGGTLDISSCDMFEDNVFGVWQGQLVQSKKLHFDDDSHAYFQNNWANNFIIESSSFFLGDDERPHFILAETDADGQVRYSPDHSMLAFAGAHADYGLQLFHFPWMDECTHKSITFDCDNPSLYHYQQHYLYPETYMTEVTE